MFLEGPRLAKAAARNQALAAALAVGFFEGLRQSARKSKMSLHGMIGCIIPSLVAHVWPAVRFAHS